MFFRFLLPIHLRTHTTENLSEQETIQRYYRQHQEQYEEWLRKTRQQADNRHQQQHQHNPNDWSGWENPNPDDPFYEVKSKIGKFLNRVSYADLFLLTAFGKMIALFLMMIILYSHFKGHWPLCTFWPVGFHLSNECFMNFQLNYYIIWKYKLF